jgi:hypothetical protein
MGFGSQNICWQINAQLESHASSSLGPTIELDDGWIGVGAKMKRPQICSAAFIVRIAKCKPLFLGPAKCQTESRQA